jgi:hypothetical protein
MKIKSQGGFSAVEGLLIFIIIAVIGGTGWYVVSANKRANDVLNNSGLGTTAKTSKKTNPVPAPQADPTTSNWKEEKNTEFNYSYKHPDEGWSVFLIKTDSKSPAYKTGERINNTGVNYDGCGSNCGLAFSFRVYTKGSEADVGTNYVENVQMKGNSVYQLTSKTNLTKNNVKGTRWEYTPSDNNVSKIVYYYFTNDKFAYFITVNENGAKTENIDITQQGEKIFSTFQFMN